MLTKINPYEFNLKADIEVRTVDKSSGQTVETWATAYSSVWMKRLSPPRGSEREEAQQPTAIQRDSFQIRNEGQTITAKDHRILLNGEYYYIVGVRPFKANVDSLVLDTEQRDNEGEEAAQPGTYNTAILLTQAEYDGLSSYGGSTYYLITDA